MRATGIGSDVTETEDVQVRAATSRRFPRDRDSGLRHIDTQNLQPQRGNVKGILACPASCVENRAGEGAFACQAHYRGLWFSNVPRRRAIQVRRIPGPACPPLVTGWSPPAIRIVG